MVERAEPRKAVEYQVTSGGRGRPLGFPFALRLHLVLHNPLTTSRCSSQGALTGLLRVPPCRVCPSAEPCRVASCCSLCHTPQLLGSGFRSRLQPRTGEDRGRWAGVMGRFCGERDAGRCLCGFWCGYTHIWQFSCYLAT